MKKIFTLFTKTLLVSVCLLGGASSAWADDYTLGASTFNSAKTIATVNGLDFTFSKAHGGGGQTGYSEYIKFSANNTYTITLPTGFQLTNVNVKGYTNKDGKDNGSFSVGSGDTHTLPARNDENLSTNAAITDGFDYAISQTGGTVAVSTSGSGNQICVLITITGTAAAPVAVDPEFSLSSPISISGEGQIKVGTKDNLDGIKLSSITYTVSGIVTVDEDGVVTPVAKGTTTINFNSSAVTDKYNASEGNSLTVTVIEPIAVYDASAANAEFVLTQTNIQASENEFVSAATENWSERTMPSPYPKTNYYNLSGTSRYITFKASGASNFQIVIQNSGSADRKYTVKIGDADGVDVTAATNSLTSSPVFATGTTGEVTIKIIGTSDGSLYPAAIKFNPTVPVGTLDGRNYASYVTTENLDFGSAEGITAYIATGLNSGGTAVEMTPVNVVPAGTPIIVKTDTKGNTVNVPVTTADADDVSGNKLVAGDGTTTWNGATGYDFYYLASDQFHKATSGTLKSGKAYLKVATSGSGAPSLSLSFGGDNGTTAIESVEKAVKADGVYYNLSGQRVAQPTKGLYIVNGKKVLIK